MCVRIRKRFRTILFVKRRISTIKMLHFYLCYAKYEMYNVYELFIIGGGGGYCDDNKSSAR